MYESPLFGIKKSVHLCKEQALEALNMTEREWQDFIKESLNEIGLCTAIGYEVGYYFNQPVLGGFTGAIVGVSIVLGNVVYKFIINKKSQSLTLIPVQ